MIEFIGDDIFYFGENVDEILAKVKRAKNDRWVPNWNDIESHISVIAMDREGFWRGYKDLPKIDIQLGRWISNNIEDCVDVHIAFEYDGYWKRSLRQRLK